MKCGTKRSKLRDFEQNLPMALLRAREAVMSRFRPILREHGLTEQQWRVIRALEGEDGLEVTALADKTLLLMPSLTRILKGMEEQGWVKRFTVEGDNRRRQMRLSKSGRELFETIAPKSELEYKLMESKVGTAALGQLYKQLEKLSR